MPALKINPKLHTSNPSASFLAGKAADSAQQPEDPRPAKPVDPDKQESPGPTSSGDGGSGLVNTVPQVVDAIGQISNFFGSSTAVETTEVTSSEQQAGPSGHPQGEGQSCDSTRPPQSGVPSDVDPSEVKGQPPGEADGSGSISIGQLSRESIKRMAGAIAEQLADPVAESMEEGGHQQSDLPSYAPEKCLARQGGGKGSPVKLPASSARDVKERKDDISKLKDILVSEKEIFGGPLPDESDSDDDNFGTDSTQMAVDTGDAMDQSDAGALEDHGVDTMEDPSSSQAVTEAQMMAEFQKLTSLNEETLKESGEEGRYLAPSLSLHPHSAFLLLSKYQKEKQAGKHRLKRVSQRILIISVTFRRSGKRRMCQSRRREWHIHRLRYELDMSLPVVVDAVGMITPLRCRMSG